MIEAEDLARAVEGWTREVAAGGDVDWSRMVSARVRLKMFGGGREDAVGPRECVGNAFAHVADDDLEVGQAIEDAGENEAQGMEAVFCVPAPAGDGESIPVSPGSPE